MELNDFKWFAHYIESENNVSVDAVEADRNDQDPAKLQHAMTIFFDTTAISISRAIDRVKNK
jgi:hypothetical protein